FKHLHLDFHSVPGLELVERLQHFNSVDPHAQIAIQLLRTWDGQLSPESAGGAVYEVVRYTLVRKILEPALGKELADVFMGKGFHELLYHSHEFHGHDTVVMLRLLDIPGSWWIKQAGGRGKLLEDSLRDAVKWLQKELGKDTSKWQWGKLHCVNFPHAMALQKPLDRVFNRGPYPIGGDNDTVCQTAFFPQDMYDAKAWAPSHRQIIDLGDLSKSLMIYAPGQSGHLGSKHYDDLIEIWQKGDFHPMFWTKEQIEANAEGKLELRPQKS
ncbi:MAG: penicillin acylase family protein, partial [Candidatus Odinarchaeota archaeon]